MKRRISLLLLLSLLLALPSCRTGKAEDANESTETDAPAYIDTLPDNGCC